MPEFVQILTTVAREEEATRLAAELVAQRLAACVQIVGPIASTYRWRGKVETAREWQCWIKTRRDRYEEVAQALRRLHSYEVPEIIVLPIVAGSADYLAWLEESTAGEAPTASDHT